MGLLAEFGGETIMRERYLEVQNERGKVSKLSDVMKGILTKKMAEGFAEGEARGRAEASNGIVSSMLKAKEPVAKIIQYTQLPLEKIQELATSLGLAVVM